MPRIWMGACRDSCWAWSRRWSGAVFQDLDFALRLQDLAVLGDRVVGDAQELGLPVGGTFRVPLHFGLDDSHALLFVEMVSGKFALANPGDLVGLGAEPFDDLCLDLLVGDAKGF